MSVRVEFCQHVMAEFFCVRDHYLSGLPAGRMQTLGTWEWETWERWEDARAVGVRVYSRGACKDLATRFGFEQTEGVELTRVAFDRRHRSPISQSLAHDVRMLKAANPRFQVVISFSDPAQRGPSGQPHSGGIYRAANFWFLGMTHAESLVRIGGELRHPRTIGSKYHTRSIAWLREHVDPNAERVIVPPKFRFAYPLTDEARERLRPFVQQFPKALVLERDRSTDSGARGPQAGEVILRPQQRHHPRGDFARKRSGRSISCMRCRMCGWLTASRSSRRDAPIAEVEFVCQARVPGGICGATARHPTNPKNMCVRGHFIPGSQQRLTHGARAFERHGDAVVPPDVRLTADDMLAGIIADKGGANNLTTLKREYAQQARHFRVMLDLILHDLVRNGVTTKGGRVRSAVSKYLEIFDRFDKVAQRLGLERDAREALSFTARLAAAPITSARRRIPMPASDATGCCPRSGRHRARRRVEHELRGRPMNWSVGATSRRPQSRPSNARSRAAGTMRCAGTIENGKGRFIEQHHRDCIAAGPGRRGDRGDAAETHAHAGCGNERSRRAAGLGLACRTRTICADSLPHSSRSSPPMMRHGSDWTGRATRAPSWSSKRLRNGASGCCRRSTVADKSDCGG